MRGTGTMSGALLVGINEVFNDLVKDLPHLSEEDALARVEEAHTQVIELVEKSR
jgi:hypothetical protein